MKHYILLFILFCSSILVNSCGKTCVEATFGFEMTAKFYPELDSIRIGDTLWALSSHLTTFTDVTTGKNIDYSGSDLGLNIQVLKLNGGTISAPGTTGAFHSFVTLVINGSEIGNDNLPDENKGIHYEQTKDSFLLKVAFMPKEKGVYAIALNNAGAVRHNHGCELAIADVENANEDNHLYLYQNSRPGYEISSYERTHMYCFKVY